MLRKGSPYAFLVLSDRAYAKMKETHKVDVSPCKDVPTDDLAAQIKRLEGQLGFEESFAGGSVKTGASVPGVDDSRGHAAEEFANNHRGAKQSFDPPADLESLLLLHHRYGCKLRPIGSQ